MNLKLTIIDNYNTTKTTFDLSEMQTKVVTKILGLQKTRQGWTMFDSSSLKKFFEMESNPLRLEIRK